MTLILHKHITLVTEWFFCPRAIYSKNGWSYGHGINCWMMQNFVLHPMTPMSARGHFSGEILDSDFSFLLDHNNHRFMTFVLFWHGVWPRKRDHPSLNSIILRSHAFWTNISIFREIRNFMIFSKFQNFLLILSKMSKSRYPARFFWQNGKNLNVLKML